MPARLLAVFILSSLYLALRPAAAQDEPTDPAYHVEIIVFEQLEGSRAEEDFFHDIDNLRDEPPPARLTLPELELETLTDFVPSQSFNTLITDSEIEAATAPEQEPLTAEDLAPEVLTEDMPEDQLELFALAGSSVSTLIRFDGTLPIGFRVLGNDELELGDVRNDVYRRREYRVLGHAGWAQTGVDEDRATGVDLNLLGITNPGGTITVYLRRFLHVAVDLEFTDGRGTFWTAYPGTGVAPLEYARSYHHDFEHNAIRSGQLVFIDHPLFGILLRITPAPEPEEPSATGPGDGPAA